MSIARRNFLPPLLVAAFTLSSCGHSAAARGPDDKDVNHHNHQRHEGHEKHPHQHSFADAAQWAKRFESAERDTWQKPEVVLAALELTDSLKVADIGSATGYFPVRIAKAVPNGRVWGVDIEPDMVRHLNQRARTEGLNNLFSVLGHADDALIPEPVDRVLVVNTYHHIASRTAYFEKLKGSLRPGAQVTIVDFVEGELPFGPPAAMKIAPSQVEAEFKAAGYELKKKVDGLPHQYVLIFEVAP